MNQDRSYRRGGEQGMDQNGPPGLEKIVKYIEKGEGELSSIFGLNGYAKSLATSPTNNKTKTHQLRRFYDYLVSIDDSLRSGEMGEFGERVFKLRLVRMIPLAAYSASPGRKLLDDGLSRFIQDSAQAVSSKSGDDFVKALGRFRDVYEAIVAYSKV